VSEKESGSLFWGGRGAAGPRQDGLDEKGEKKKFSPWEIHGGSPKGKKRKESTLRRGRERPG